MDPKDLQAELDRIREERDKARAELAQLQSDDDEATAFLTAEHERAIARLLKAHAAELERLRATNHQLEQAVAAAARAMTTLRKERDEIAATSSIVEMERDRAQARLEKVAAEGGGQEERLAQLERERKSLEERVAQLEKERNTAKSQAAALAAELRETMSMMSR